jgi:hypothetical protein
MGFGGGAMIGAPLAPPDQLFQDPDLGRRVGDVRYDGRHLLRLHDDRRFPPSEKKSMISEHHVHLDNAHKTPQFWLIWWVL